MSRKQQYKEIMGVSPSYFQHFAIFPSRDCGKSFLFPAFEQTNFPTGFIPAVLKNSSILRMAPLLCPKIHEKGAGVLQAVNSIYFFPDNRGLGNVLVSSIAVPNSRSIKFYTGAGTFAQ